MPKPPLRRAAAKRRPVMVYLDPDLHRAAKMRSAAMGESVSDQVNEALRAKLREDEADQRVFREREKEPSRPYEEFLAELKGRGLL